MRFAARRKAFIAALYLLIVIFIAAKPCGAWNAATHMVTGAIAYDELKARDKTALANVVALLKSHPDYGTRWKNAIAKNNIAPADHDLYLFMLAARWPDDIRRKQANDHPEWHYVNIPIRLGTMGGRADDIEREDENILTSFRQNAAVLQNARATKAQKAVALCWLFHLIGDVHQPLHTTKLVSAQFNTPVGDRGGTRFYVRARADRATISLHQFWDDLVIGSPRFRSVRNRATLLRADQPRETYPELTTRRTTNFEMWAKTESYALAVRETYRGGELEGSRDKTNGVVLPPDYVIRAKTIGERRATLSGYRLADTLARLL